MMKEIVVSLCILVVAEFCVILVLSFASDYPNGVEVGVAEEGYPFISIMEGFGNPENQVDMGRKVLVYNADGKLRIDVMSATSDLTFIPISINMEESGRNSLVFDRDGSMEDLVIDNDGDGIPDMKASKDDGLYLLEDIAWRKDER